MTTTRVRLAELRDRAARARVQLHVDSERREAYVRIGQTRYVAELDDSNT